MKKESAFTWKLGMFVIIGLALFIYTIYYIGKQQNLFIPTIHLQSEFKTVSGLKIGNHVRFSGINIGTVNEINLISDTSVLVDMIIRKKYQEFIKTDASAAIGSDGLMGDKVLTITPGTSRGSASKTVVSKDMIASKNAIEMEDVMKSIKTSVDNAGLITAQIAEFTYKMNNGNGALNKLINDKEFSKNLSGTLVNLENSSKEFAQFTVKMNNGNGALSKLVSDEKFASSLDSTMQNLQTGSQRLSEIMEAAQNSFLIRGFFKKKEKAEAKLQADIQEQEELKIKIDNKIQLINAKDSINQ